VGHVDAALADSMILRFHWRWSVACIESTLATAV